MTLVEKLANIDWDNLEEREYEKIREEIIREFQRHSKDVGSPEVQAALLTLRIERLKHHFKRFSKDYASKRGFLKMIDKRRKILRYLKEEDPKRYEEIIRKIGI